ncbi:hypothetical protein SARC_15813 [Sphaeroforma arctica JP610]|uniref:Uncharacterized protein n=1 Tax=Sphaeroforma arctica JP610 TaxID=667725 RepID=A0A0L0F4Y1_9EUKA|nr:hypothetical protein SARC_15813 [Sphaeroforma arctica JP610]KNC71649.1 hypothetical protein SARC_15813 [Sphaeroforma arctica JP610]|eukprot:XP_014145551.1 hypothetical protein SARC_15813 [Sphaeroforma arctica JP610]
MLHYQHITLRMLKGCAIYTLGPMVNAGTALATGKTGTATTAATPAGAAPKKAYSAWDKLVSSGEKILSYPARLSQMD